MSDAGVRAGRVTRRARTHTRASSQTEVALHHPIRLGFYVALGGFAAWWLGGLILSVGSILILILVAAFIAAGLNPIVEWLGRRGVRRSWGVLVVITGLILALVLFVVALVPVITDQVSMIVKNAPGWVDQLQHNVTIQRLDRRYDLIKKARTRCRAARSARRCSAASLASVSSCSRSWATPSSSSCWCSTSWPRSRR